MACAVVPSVAPPRGLRSVTLNVAFPSASVLSFRGTTKLLLVSFFPNESVP